MCKVKNLVAGIHSDFVRLEKLQDNDGATNAELGFSEHIKAVSTHVIDLATAIVTEFPSGIPNSKGKEVLAELESTKAVVEQFVDRLHKIVKLRIKGDENSMKSSAKQILELENYMNKELQVLGVKVDFAESLERQRRRDMRPMLSEPSMTKPSSSVGMTNRGGALGHSYVLSHDSFHMSAHDKNELDLVVSQAEESVVKNLGLGIEKHPTNKKHSKKKITK